MRKILLAVALSALFSVLARAAHVQTCNGSHNTVPDSLDGVLDNLEADHDYLLAGDVFTPDLIETWIELKRDDIDAVRLRPHPHEFELYYDV